MEDYINPKTSMMLVGLVLVVASVLSLLFVAFSDTNRKRYVFMKTLRNAAVFVITPAFFLLFLFQIISLLKYNYLSISNSAIPLVYMIGGGFGIYYSGFKFKRMAYEGIAHFRRGSFNSAKFQKIFNLCRLQLVGMIFLCLAILAMVFVFR